MNILRLICAVFLSLALGLAPVATGFSRDSTSLLETLTICTGDGTKTISINQDGQPVETNHVCLDCCLVFNQQPENSALLTSSRQARLVSHGFLSYRTAIFQRAVKPDTRAPPVLN